MQNSFDTLIDSFIQDKIGITQNFLNIKLAAHLKENLLRLFAEKQLQNAGTGNDALATQDKAVRGDMIYWLDREHNDTHENNFFDLMDEFVTYLNATCYTGITGYEFHYALYPIGSFYKKHVDQFKNNSVRQFSMITYLNADWKEEDGGQLCVHQNGTKQNIPPSDGKSVFFKSSELEHEVLLSNKARMSITGWFTIKN